MSISNHFHCTDNSILFLCEKDYGKMIDVATWTLQMSFAFGVGLSCS